MSAGSGDDDYSQTSTGLRVLFRDFRQGERKEGRPVVDWGQKWVDRSFGLNEAMRGLDLRPNQAPTSWMRPPDLREEPQLFTDGVTRYDIGQGAAGTCWFLSTAASIGANPEQLNLVFPDDAYKVGTEDYDGVFHCRFWRFGQWEDVYIDDYLPVIYRDQIWGARSATDKDEFWVSLLEKAFARHHGSYSAVYGGQPGDAYLALTGGVGERIDLEKKEASAQVYSRIRNAINSGAFVTCAVPEKHDKLFGLVGAHAYTVTGTATVRGTDLLRIRNPWGSTEWKGPWSDGSPEWNDVSVDDVSHVVKDDGEFWISLKDFMTYFDQATVCSLTPDFDQDGRTDSMYYVTNLYGEWRDETAAGSLDRLSNPRYAFTVSGADDEIPLVVQLIQWRDSRKMDNFYARLDVYKVLSDDGQTVALELMGDNTNTYLMATQCSYRHKVTPGTYVVVPSTNTDGKEKSFLIRVFTDRPLLDIRALSRDYRVMSCEPEKSITYTGKDYALKYSEAMTGQWETGVNAGGQISYNETHETNPQYVISVSETTMVAIYLVQEQIGSRMPIGLRLYPTGEAPMSLQNIYKLYNKALRNTEGDLYRFVVAWDFSSAYLLDPGQYTLLIHMDKPDTEKVFTLVVKSSNYVKVEGFQTGM